MWKKHISTMLMRQCLNTIDYLKKINSLPTESQLTAFYHPSEAQKNGEQLFVAVGTGIATYAFYKYLK